MLIKKMKLVMKHILTLLTTLHTHMHKDTETSAGEKKVVVDNLHNENFNIKKVNAIFLCDILLAKYSPSWIWRA